MSTASDVRCTVIIDGRRGIATVTQEAIEAHERVISWLDVDDLDEGDHRLTLQLGDGTSVTLDHTGSGHDTFVAALRRFRRQARFPALTIAAREPLASFVSRTPNGLTDIHLFDDTLAIEPRRGAPVAVPYALIDQIDRDRHTITCRCTGVGDIAVGGLGAATDGVEDRLRTLRTASIRRTSVAATALDPALDGITIANGRALDQATAGRWWDSLRACAARSDRATEFETITRRAQRLSIGIAASEESTPWLFVIATNGSCTVVEGLTSDDRATFVFEGIEPMRLNALLMLTSFRREVLTVDAASAGRWAAALRTVAAVRELREHLHSRIVHDDRWGDEISEAMSEDRSTL